MVEDNTINAKLPIENAPQPVINVKITLEKTNTEDDNISASQMESIKPKSEDNIVYSDSVVEKRKPKIQLHLDSSEQEPQAPYRSESRKKIMWTAAEAEALKKHVEKYGFRWKLILENHKDDFAEGRRIIDLKNKYNMISKANTFYTTPKKRWVIMQNGVPKRDEEGNLTVVIEKFPFNAAKKLAKTQRFSGYETYILNIAQADDLDDIHCYTVSVTQDKYQVKKLRREEE